MAVNWRKVAKTRCADRCGQGATEFMMMIPLIMALAFLVIEFAFYFGTVHYDNYAAFAAARAVQVGGDASAVKDLLLNGNVTRHATLDVGSDRATVKQPWGDAYNSHLPGMHMVLPRDMKFQVTVVLGPDESQYEGRASFYGHFDNNM